MASANLASIRGVRTFTFVGGSSSKFWEIDRTGAELTIRFGRIGTNGQTQVKAFADDVAAEAQLAKLVAEKVAKGYVETSEEGTVAAPVPSPPGPKLSVSDDAVRWEQWVEHDLDLSLDMGGCVTIAVGISLEAVLQAFGATTPLPGDLDVEPRIEVWTTANGAVVVAESGYEGSRDEVLKVASATGRVGSFYWSIDWNSSLSLAERRKVLVSEDVVLGVPEDLPRKLSSTFRGLDFEEHPLGQGLVAIERFTGLSTPMAESGLTPVGTFLIEPVPDDRWLVITEKPAFNPEDDLDFEVLNAYCTWWTLAESEVGELLTMQFIAMAAAVPERCRSLAAMALRRVAEDRAVQSNPMIAKPLFSLEAGKTPAFSRDAGKSIQRALRLPYGAPVPPEFKALRVLEAACHPDEIRAGLDAFFLAHGTFRKRKAEADAFWAAGIELLGGS